MCSQTFFDGTVEPNTTDILYSPAPNRAANFWAQRGWSWNLWASCREVLEPMLAKMAEIFGPNLAQTPSACKKGFGPNYAERSWNLPRLCGEVLEPTFPHLEVIPQRKCDTAARKSYSTCVLACSLPVRCWHGAGSKEPKALKRSCQCVVMHGELRV